ncbi:DUF4258 domain-containing protein [Lamprobacter modestohalophilus]|uniref:DUF4258 domain-containing protein n=1 Tax=Lamprobacter modestohalophilus TaxID=1064514 RepID=UPI002ADEB765|nr:DUF4258 domain-containing protein [Lamprobacter modestohalophilus]MEA1052495.1 DUF4258 domain-containing protein [Lamprobacter modestohalophilus]
MHATQHIQQRMSQRGVSRDMVQLVLNHGRTEQDKYILGRKEASQRLGVIQRESRLLKKVLDKGGVVVIADGESLITTYNYVPKHGRPYQR